MFYSQFILAKKGPLGTIWIAAHLERKLRKNQVADTDIGVSVDSILFPDVPIALRLSSHLLLGVVRIYSKKVNYLFHDCSEALIKIKQAFRSTAVDLPPEESTAPYHSITLPETFDLDNFELPDSAFLDSNFVDHHVSTREQITLQDTVNGAAFPTSKFGLDERFGDGDASQIGLELDEDLFMDKSISQQHDGFSMDSKVSGVHHGETSVPSSSIAIEVQFGYDEEKGRKVPNELSELLSNNYDRNCFSSVEDLRRDTVSSHRHGYSIQTPDLNEVFLPDCHTALSPSTPHIPFTPEEAQTPCLMEPAQAPSTPGLLEEVIPSNFQEVPALSPQEKAGIYVESGRSALCSRPYMEVECIEAGNKSGLTSGALGHKSGETAEELLHTSDLIVPMSESLPPTHSSMNLTKIDIVHFVSGAENQQSGLTGEAENTADHRHDNVEAIFPSGYSHETANMPSTPKPAASFETEPVTSNTCKDNLDLLGFISDVKGVPLNDNNEPSDIGNLVRLEDGDSCISINTSAVGTDFVLRSCGSNLLPPNSHIVDGALGETSELSPRDHYCNFRTPMQEDVPHICESSFEVQGEHSSYTNGGVINLDGKQASICMPSVVKSVATKKDELSTGVLSNFFQLDRVNYSSSSEFLGPYKMLASVCDVDFPDQGFQTTCKGVIVSDGSIDRTSSHCSRKRRIMDSSANLQTGSSAKLSGIPRSRRNADYIPDDDDVLASILVGRKVPSLKMGQTTSLSKASSQKRPRTISRLGMPKRRKVVVDDTMVLQADAIRQQLINTDDIRRMRKKAPCTRPEILRIYIGATEDEIFYHSALIGISLQLNNLNDQYILQSDPHVKTSGEAVSSKVSEFVNETGDKEMGGSILFMPGIIGEMGGPSRISVSDTIPSHEVGAQCDVHDQLEELLDRPQAGPLSNDHVAVISSMEADAEAGANSIIQEILIPEIDKSASFLEKLDNKSFNLAERSAYTEAQNPLNTPNDGSDFAECATIVAINGDSAFAAVVSETFIQAENVCNAVGATINEEEKTGNALDAKYSESNYEGITSNVGTNVMVVTDGSAFVVQGDEAPEQDLRDGKRPITDVACGELPNIVSLESSIEHAPLTMVENSCTHKFNLEGGLDVGNIPVDIGAARDSTDFCSTINDSYTGFLNVDDEPDFDESENEAPNTEAQSLENSGWSARTRGVARYLKVLFDESGRGRKTIAVDRLLAGKTRKEASRMFFETLVLKTRDYIQVEQEKPFEYINIKPRTKLLVSEF